jgi:UDPglucose--hexose-1-phosphate uridylyltransferase
MLPGILLELGGDGADWKVRVVPNRYPALTPQGKKTEDCYGAYRFAQVSGHHEVVIESKSHNRSIDALTPADAGYVIEAYHRRYGELAEKPEVQSVVVFRNHGVKAGSSLPHPHSQIIATSFVPQSVSARKRLSISHFKASGRCLLCEIVAIEARDLERMVFQNEHFSGFVPYAAESPCEMWIVPKNHRADFADISDDEKASLTEALQSSLGCIRDKLNDADCNLAIHSIALNEGLVAAALHWYVQIQPRLTTPAGFEMASGVRINPSLPEMDAAFLRS